MIMHQYTPQTCLKDNNAKHVHTSSLLFSFQDTTLCVRTCPLFQTHAPTPRTIGHTNSKCTSLLQAQVPELGKLGHKGTMSLHEQQMHILPQNSRSCTFLGLVDNVQCMNTRCTSLLQAQVLVLILAPNVAIKKDSAPIHQAQVSTMLSTMAKLAREPLL